MDWWATSRLGLVKTDPMFPINLIKFIYRHFIFLWHRIWSQRPSLFYFNNYCEVTNFDHNPTNNIQDGWKITETPCNIFCLLRNSDAVFTNVFWRQGLVFLVVQFSNLDPKGSESRRPLWKLDDNLGLWYIIVFYHKNTKKNMQSK